MHSSKIQSFRKILPYLIGLAVCAFIIKALDIALYPCTYTRNDIHTVVSDQKDVIILGTSNGKMNIDPDIMLDGTGLSGHNLDPAYYMEEKEPGNNYLLFYHEFPLSRTKVSYFKDALLNLDFRAWLFPFYEYELSYELNHIGSNLSQKLNGDYDIGRLKNEIQQYHENGFIEKFPVSPDRFPPYEPELFDEEKLLPENMAWIDKLIETCHEEGIDIIALSTPLPGVALKKDEESFLAAWKYLAEYFDKRGVRFYNFNRELFKAFPHDTELYVDLDGHMNGDSARAFSRTLGKVLWGEKKGENENG